MFTVWSADLVLECHGLVRSWGFRVSRSGPLMRFGVTRSGPLIGFWSVTVWSADGVLECHVLVR